MDVGRKYQGFCLWMRGQDLRGGFPADLIRLRYIIRLRAVGQRFRSYMNDVAVQQGLQSGIAEVFEVTTGVPK